MSIPIDLCFLGVSTNGCLTHEIALDDRFIDLMGEKEYDRFSGELHTLLTKYLPLEDYFKMKTELKKENT